MRIDFHRHLEGSHSARALLLVAKKFQLQDPLFFQAGVYRTEAELAPLLQMQGEAGNASTFYTAIETARRAYVSPEAIAALTYESFIDSAAEVDALEMRVSLFSMTRTLFGVKWRHVEPMTFAEKSREVLIGLIDARDRAEKTTHKKLLVRLGLSRTFESETHYRAMASVIREHASALCGLDVLGILSGPDKEPLQPGLVAIIDTLRDVLGDLTIHAGEFEDHRSVDRALALSPRGIGHGVRALGSDATLQTLRDHGVTLEVCPSSNQLLIPEVVAELRQSEHGKHPICALHDHGVFAVLGSDDPVPMSTSFTTEWKLATELGVNPERLASDSERRWEQLAG